MSRVLVDRIETQQDELQFGDPIGCSHHWLEPDMIDAYGDSVRRLATKVELAVDAFDRTATLSEDVFAGEAADTLRDPSGTSTCRTPSPASRGSSPSRSTGSRPTGPTSRTGSVSARLIPDTGPHV